MNLFNGTGLAQNVAPVENRVLVYEKDSQTLKPIKINYSSSKSKITTTTLISL